MTRLTGVYYLYYFHSADCEHLPVLFQLAHGRTEDEERKRLQKLIESYERDILSCGCHPGHRGTLLGRFVGEMPGAEELNGVDQEGYIHLWVAETENGAPEVVIGIADTEQDFWRIARRRSPRGVKLVKPAWPLRVLYLPEGEGSVRPPDRPCAPYEPRGQR